MPGEDGYGDVLRPSWMSPNLGAKPISETPRVEQLEQRDPPILVDELEQQEPPEVPTTDEERTVVELDLIGQIAALQRKLEAVTEPKNQDDMDEEEALQAMLEDPPLPKQDGPSRVLLLTYQLPIRCFRDEQGLVQWRPSNGEANLAHAMAGVPDATEVVWFGQIHEADTGDIRDDEKQDLSAHAAAATPPMACRPPVSSSPLRAVALTAAPADLQSSGCGTTTRGSRWSRSSCPS
jgi:hypothetical protein